MTDQEKIFIMYNRWWRLSLISKKFLQISRENINNPLRNWTKSIMLCTCMSWGRVGWRVGAEREGESLRQAPHSAWSPMQISIPWPWDHGTWGEVRSQTFNVLSHPDAPGKNFTDWLLDYWQRYSYCPDGCINWCKFVKGNLVTLKVKMCSPLVLLIHYSYVRCCHSGKVDTW